jgi:hypothetical protein
MSNAILNITDGDDIIKIKNKWIKEENCQDNGDLDLNSKGLNFRSFWQLFAFNGAVCTVSLIIFVLRKKQGKINILFCKVFPIREKNEFKKLPPVFQTKNLQPER